MGDISIKRVLFIITGITHERITFLLYCSKSHRQLFTVINYALGITDNKPICLQAVPFYVIGTMFTHMKAVTCAKGVSPDCNIRYTPSQRQVLLL